MCANLVTNYTKHLTANKSFSMKSLFSGVLFEIVSLQLNETTIKIQQRIK